MAACSDFIKRSGHAGGTPVLYFHGAPGAPAEAALIEAAARQHEVELWAIDRARLAATGPGTVYIDQLAALVAAVQSGRRLPILGFSIGAGLALRVAARLDRETGPLFLLSAGGPLELPGALDGMGAGAGVFRSAQSNGAAFALTVGIQALMARCAPGMLQQLLFAGADPHDRAFAATPNGRAMITRILAEAWANQGRGYRADLMAYVASWADELQAISSPVRLWHGISDRWAPIGMGRAIAERLTDSRLSEGPDGHYTTLINHAPAALAAVAG